MTDLNRVTLIGRLGRAPEVRRFADGGRIVTFSLATSARWNAAAGKTERTEWHTVVVRNERIADFVENNLRMGHRIAIEGVLRYRKWQAQDGTERVSAEVVIPPWGGFLQALEKIERAASEAGAADPGAAAPAASSVIDDDEIPF